MSKKIETIKLQEIFSFECYGTRVNVKTDHHLLKSKLRKYLHIFEFESKHEMSPDSFMVSVIANHDKDTNGLYIEDEKIMLFDGSQEVSFEYAADRILMMMAIVSLPSKIYLHAGAVVWNRLGILVPGISCAGKTTLVKEFIKAGAVYYSDDCIILDDKNNMLPFPRALSIRTENGKILREAAYFGAKNGVEKVKVDLILFARYQQNAVWQGEKLSPGACVLKLMDNFYLRSSVGNAPSEIIKLLTNLATEATSYSGERGDASQILEWISQKFSL